MFTPFAKRCVRSSDWFDEV